MALTGSYGDLYIRQYTDLIEHEMQQNGSVLRGLVTLEPGLMGERRYFPKLGKSTSYEITGRSQAVQVQDATFERRFVTPRAIEAVHRIEMLDVIRYQSSPDAELVSSMAQELGRQIDAIIISAMAGSAGRELDGTSSAASFDSNNTIAVNTNTFQAGSTAMTGDTGLHEGKLINMKRRLLTNYALRPGDELFVIAPAIQLAGLHQRVLLNPGAGFFQKNLPDVHHPMLDLGLDGFLGARYIQFEDTGVDGSSDQYVYMFLRKSVKLGFWQDVKFTQSIIDTAAGDPVQFKANMALGAVRMWEEGIMRVLCDPTPLYA